MGKKFVTMGARWAPGRRETRGSDGSYELVNGAGPNEPPHLADGLQVGERAAWIDGDGPTLVLGIGLLVSFFAPMLWEPPSIMVDALAALLAGLCCLAMGALIAVRLIREGR
jgi:hypothetical protein